MNRSKIQLAIIAFITAIILAVFVGIRFASPNTDLMEQIGNRAIQECQKNGVALSIGSKQTSGLVIKTLTFYDVVAEFNPFYLTFSSISATPSITAMTSNAIDGKLSARHVTLELPFLGAIHFGNGSAHVRIDEEDNTFVRDFKFSGACNVKGHFTITKDSKFTDYRFVFTPKKEQQALFTTLATLGTPLRKISDDQWLLESEPK